jgi:uncharacterized membrane protein YiaA
MRVVDSNETSTYPRFTKLERKLMANSVYRPSGAFVGASWAALIVGAVGFLFGIWNSPLARSEKGFYFIVIMYGLFSVVSLQKSIRDRLEGIRVTNQYYAMCWVSVGLCTVLFGMGLFNATTLAMNEKGFFAMAFLMALFGAIAVQKNTRDLAISSRNTDD